MKYFWTILFAVILILSGGIFGWLVACDDTLVSTIAWMMFVPAFVILPAIFIEIKREYFDGY